MPVYSLSLHRIGVVLAGSMRDTSALHCQKLCFETTAWNATILLQPRQRNCAICTPGFVCEKLPQAFSRALDGRGHQLSNDLSEGVADINSITSESSESIPIACGCSLAEKKVPGAQLLFRLSSHMSVQVYGCNHVAIEVDDVEKAVAFYKDVFNLEQMRGGEGDAFFKLGEHQFLAIFEVEKVQPANVRHFGIMVRDETQLAEVRKKLKEKYKLKLEPPFRCDFRDPWGNRIQVVDLHDESLVWLLPYGEVQKAGIKFDTK